MSIRTTVTLDEDVLERVKAFSKERGESFRDTLNNLLRAGILVAESPRTRGELEIRPFPMGYTPGLNYDDVEGLLERGEGERHR
jgi:hypothetical protein